MQQVSSTGDRVRSVRKRCGLTQRELATSAGISLSLVKKLEQDEYGDMRMETVHKLAIVLRVPTSALAAGPDAAEPESDDVEQWAPVRHALEGSMPPSADSEPTLDGLRHAFDTTVSDVLASRYVEVRAALPALLQDADALVSLKQYAEAVDVLQDVRRAAPEWLLQQRYARDILGRVVERRRTLTPDMRELADAVRLPCNSGCPFSPHPGHRTIAASSGRS